MLGLHAPMLLLTAALSVLVCAAHAQELVSLDTRPGVVQSYFLARIPESPRAVALLFPGGGGYIRLRSEAGQIKFAMGNFLVRARGQFVRHGVVAAILEAPTDAQSGWGMTDEFRSSEKHRTDVCAVLTHLGHRFPDVPLFLVGTSRGSVSAARLATRLEPGIAGIVLTSTMYRAAGPRSREPGPGLSQFDFASLKAPVLLVHHHDDGCAASPYVDAYLLARQFPLVTVRGGLPPTSAACEPMSPHGFLGRETETIEAIVNWMLKRPYAQDIGAPPGR